MKKAHKVLMIGLDGATFSLLKPLMEDGVMPFLKGFVASGVHADLMSTRNPLTPPAWTSMITGRSPHVHGIYDFLQPLVLEDGGVFLTINDSRHNRCETIWSMVNRQGKRATTLNFYGMSPAPAVDGYVASGFVPWKYLRQGIHPEGLFDTIKSLPSFDYKMLGMDIGEEKKCVQGLLEGEHSEWIQLQVDRDRAWTDLCCHLMQADRTELTCVVLDGPDKVQHLFWRFLDPAHFDPEPNDWFLDIRRRCLDYYRGLDANIQRMVETAGEDTDVIMTSDHGFGPTTEIVYINEWLAREGLLKWRETVSDDGIGQLTAERIKDYLGMVDWKNTLAFCPTPSSNAIYLKRDNGSGYGVKSDGYLDFCLRLREQLLSYRDPAGEPVFVAVSLNKLEGIPYVESSPDVTLTLRDGGFVSILKSSQVVMPRPHTDGTHRPNGIFIGRGPMLGNSAQPVEALDLLQITPLMLHMLGVPVPRDLEAPVPEQILREGEPVEQGASTTAPATSEGEDQAEASEEEREALIRQMRLLGYMD